MTRRLQAALAPLLRGARGATRVRAPAAQSRGRILLPALLVLLLLAGTAAAGAYLWLERSFTAPGPAAAASRIEVEPGASLRTVLVHLEQAGTLRNARAVQWYLRLNGTAREASRRGCTRSRRTPARADPRRSSPRAR